jgi:hypothetical protein
MGRVSLPDGVGSSPHCFLVPFVPRAQTATLVYASWSPSLLEHKPSLGSSVNRGTLHPIGTDPSARLVG